MAKLQVLLVLVAIVPSASWADVIYFDNSNGQFFWRKLDSFWETGYNQNPVLFDPTLPPTQSGVDSPTSFEYLEQYSAPNLRPGWTEVIGKTGSAEVAAGTPVSNAPGIGFLTPVLPLEVGSAVGPQNSFWNDPLLAWEQDPSRTTAPSQDFLGPHGFIGLRVNEADGWHYAWLELQYDATQFWTPAGTVEIGYRATHWAYNTTANAPITVPEPAATPLVCGALLILLRRNGATGKKRWMSPLLSPPLLSPDISHTSLQNWDGLVLPTPGTDILFVRKHAAVVVDDSNLLTHTKWSSSAPEVNIGSLYIEGSPAMPVAVWDFYGKRRPSSNVSAGAVEQHPVA